MSKEIERQAEAAAQSKLLEKSGLEQTTAVAISGPPQLRRGERSEFLGVFPEQVLKAVSNSALKGAQKTVPPELREALDDSRCNRVLIKAAMIPHARSILQQVRARAMPLTVVHSPEYNNDTAVVLASDQVINQDRLWIR